MLRASVEQRAQAVAVKREGAFPARLALWGVGAFLFLAPSQFCNHPPTDFNYWPQTLALLFLCGLALCLALASSLPAPHWDGISALLLAFLGWNLVAVLAGVYAHDAWLELGRVTGGLFLFFALRALRGHLRAITVVAVLGACVPAAGALIDFVTSHNTRQMGGGFPYTVAFLNSNLFAAMLAPSLLLSALLPMEAWRRTGKAALVIVACGPGALLALALALTSSKGGFAAALVGGLVLLAALLRARGEALGRMARKAWPLLLVVALVFGAVAVKTVGRRLAIAHGADDNSTQFRAVLWRSTLHMANARPLTGFGPGAFPTVYPRYALAGYTRTAHESWLQIAAESGWPSLALLVGAFVLAVRAGWRKLKTPEFAMGACGLAALTAVIVHGFFDAPWSVLAVVGVVSLSLALCGEAEETAPEPQRRGLNWPFLGATLVLLLAGYGTQQVAGGEDLRALADHNLRLGLPAPQVEAALTTDPGSARVWNFAARATPMDDRATWETRFNRAMSLQPDSASHPRAYASKLAKVTAATGADVKRVDELYDRAVALDPLNTSLRMERGRWRYDHKDRRAFDDFAQVLGEWDAPYGKYPALGRDLDVNLDFARAVLALAPKLRAHGRLAPLVQRALADCALARSLQRQNQALIQAGQGESSINHFDDLDDLESGLRRLANANP